MTRLEVEITGAGYLRLAADVAAACFPSNAAVAVRRGRELWLFTARGDGGGGQVLKQRNARGDRAVLVREALPDGTPPGTKLALWDAEAGALRVAIGSAGEGGDGQPVSR